MRRALAVMVVGCAACGNPTNPLGDASSGDAADPVFDADEGIGFRVTMDVIGVRDPIQATLSDEIDQTTQTITITEDGPLRFPRRIPDQHAFAITVDNVQPCMPATTTGSIATADATVAITCNGVIDVHTIKSGETSTPLRFQPRFDPQITVYDAVFAPLLVDPGSGTTLVGISSYATVDLAPASVTWPAAAATEVPVVATTTHDPFGTNQYTMTMTRKLLPEGSARPMAPAAASHLGGIFSTAEPGVSGAAVGISGDVMVVGEPGTFPSIGAGAAHIHRRSGLHWTLEQSIAPPAPNTNFGVSVAVDGDTVVIGAPTDGGNGAAFVYRKTGASWVLVASLRPPSLVSLANGGALFGGAVAISKPFLVVGAASHDGAGGNAIGGAAYLFQDDGAGGWIPLGTGPLVRGTNSERLGAAVAITSTRLALGAPGNSGFSSVHTFKLVNNAWVPDTAPKILDPTIGGNRFGEAVALSGDLLVVGSQAEIRSGQNNAGAARVFHNNNGTWSLASTLSVAQAGAFFGYSVGVFGHHVIVGAPGQDSGSPASGAVHYFRCSDVGVCPASPEHTQPSPNPTNGARFGTSVAIDGVTIVAGTPNEDGGAQDSGAAYIFR